MVALRKQSTSVCIMWVSIFGGNFVLAKVRRGLISVRCLELRGVRFLEVRGGK